LKYDGPLLGVPKDYPLTNDVKFVQEQIDKDPTKTNPYYYCVPHDCVELNPLIMGTLVSLVHGLDLDSICVLEIVPLDSFDKHVVISCKQLEPGDYSISHEMTEETDILLYDLIYPLMSFVGYAWDAREKKLDRVTVYSCMPLSQWNIDMGYFRNYFRDHPDDYQCEEI
jgi:hypothetical protein